MIWFHAYELKPRGALNAFHRDACPRAGALLRVGGGFADLCPWPELGDAPFETQLAILKQGGTTPLLAASLRAAACDAEAREKSLSLFAGLSSPPNHYLLTDLDAGLAAGAVRAAGFTKIKIKVGPSDAPKFESLRRSHSEFAFKWRLDFNGTLTPESFADFLGQLSPETLDAVDFFEDPVPYASKTWRELSERHSVRLGLDRTDRVERDGVDLFVLKPAAQSTDAFVEAAALDLKRVVFTSAMDHPVGQVHAAAVAARAFTRHPLLVEECGLLTHTLYQSSAFSEGLRIEGTRLVPPAGHGVGFDETLARLDWRKCS